MKKKSKAVSIQLFLVAAIGSVASCHRKESSSLSPSSEPSPSYSSPEPSSPSESFSPVEKELVGIEVATAPNRLSYFEGETFNPEGMVVKALFKDMTKRVLDDEDYTLDPMRPLTLSDDHVTVSYQGFKATIEITVSADTTHSISILTPASKKSYRVGEVFDPTGMVLQVEKESGKKIEVAYSSSDPLFSFDTTPIGEGKTSVTITYDGKTTEHPIVLVTLTGIEVDQLPAKTSYYVGEVFDPTGLSVNAIYSDSSKEAVPLSSLTYSPATALTLADTTITINYLSFQTTLAITVKEDSVSNVEITTAPRKTTYYPGESFDATGLVLKVTYQSGKTEVVSYSEDNSNFILPSTAFEEGNTEVTFTYAGIVVRQAISVLTVTGIEITALPSKTTYYIGDFFSPEGLVVSAVYSDSSKKVLASSLYDYDKKTALKAEDTTVTVTYRTFKASFSISVKEDALASVKVKTAPSKTTYYPGEIFSAEGLVVTVSRESGASEDVTYSSSDKRFALENTVLKEGMSQVSLLYLTQTLTIPVSVHTASSLILVSGPSKAYYEVGETFDPTGMSIHGLFEDSSEKEIPLSLFSYSPSGALSVDDTTITFSYGALTLEVPIHLSDNVTAVTVVSGPTKSVYAAGDVYDPTGMVIQVSYESGKTEEVTYSADDSRFSFDKTPITEETTEIELSFMGYAFREKVLQERSYLEFGAYIQDIKNGVHTENFTHSLLYDFTKDKYLVDSKSYSEIKGSTTDGTYLYVAATPGEKGTATRIFKLDPSDGSVLAYTSEFTGFSALNIPLWLKGGSLYALSSTGTETVSLTDLNATPKGATLTTISDPSFTKDGSNLNFRESASSTSYFNDVKYSDTHGQYIGLHVETGKTELYFFDSKGSFVKSSPVSGSGQVQLPGKSEKDNLWTPHLQISDNYLYVGFFNVYLDKDSYPVLDVYQYDGTLVSQSYQINQTVLTANAYTKCNEITVFHDSLYSFFSDPNWRSGPLSVDPALVKTTTTDLQTR